MIAFIAVVATSHPLTLPIEPFSCTFYLLPSLTLPYFSIRPAAQQQLPLDFSSFFLVPDRSIDDDEDETRPLPYPTLP